MALNESTFSQSIIFGKRWGCNEFDSVFCGEDMLFSHRIFGSCIGSIGNTRLQICPQKTCFGNMLPPADSVPMESYGSKKMDWNLIHGQIYYRMPQEEPLKHVLNMAKCPKIQLTFCWRFFSTWKNVKCISGGPWADRCRWSYNLYKCPKMNGFSPGVISTYLYPPGN